MSLHGDTTPQGDAIHPADLRDKVALVTGAARGLGAAAVRLFAAHGASVVVCDVREQEGESLAAELRGCLHSAASSRSMLRAQPIGSASRKPLPANWVRFIFWSTTPRSSCAAA